MATTKRRISPLGVRLPEELRLWVKQAAAKARRSLNAEIAVRLEDSRRREEETRTQQ